MSSKRNINRLMINLSELKVGDRIEEYNNLFNFDRKATVIAIREKEFDYKLDIKEHYNRPLYGWDELGTVFEHGFPHWRKI